MSRKRQRLLSFSLILLLIIIIISLLAACEPAKTIKIWNRTDDTLSIFIRDTPKGPLPPDTKKDYGSLLWRAEYTIVAKNPEGAVIYSQKFAWEELTWLDWKVIIK